MGSFIGILFSFAVPGDDTKFARKEREGSVRLLLSLRPVGGESVNCLEPHPRYEMEPKRTPFEALSITDTIASSLSVLAS